ncbi:hypothetical protein A2U01_0095272, partial [Trifolium medium]|nr:hypothetical protein [Trifolium medium]
MREGFKKMKESSMNLRVKRMGFL